MNSALLRLLLIVPLAVTFCVQAQSIETGSFEAANRLYDQGKFQDAARAYQELIRAGNPSVSLYFNLGNSYFKSGQLGRAIATYRTLEATIPRDPDLDGNLRFALGQVQGPTWREGAVSRWLRRLTLNEWTLLATAGFWATLLLLAWGQFQPMRLRTLRPWLLISAVSTLVVTACLIIALRQNWGTSRAIVIATEAIARRGPLEEAERAFTLQDGAELRVLDRNADWAQVSPGEGSSGWVKVDQLLLRK